jgi:hypothetical protein
VAGPELAVARVACKQGRIYRLNEMDAHHVTAWSKGVQSKLGNCVMLCVTHNRAKGNR